MLRIHFTPDDLARIRLAPCADATAELTLSLRLLTGRPAGARLSVWRRSLGRRLGPQSRLLLDLLGPGAGLPDFFHLPDGSAIGPEVTGLDQQRVDHYLGRLGEVRPLTPFARALGEGSVDARQQLGAAVQDYLADAVEPYWSGLRAQVDADRSLRSRALADGGVERLLSTLHPRIRWRAPVLEVALTQPQDVEVQLCGQGLLLQPVVLGGPGPVFDGWSALSGGRPELIYPTALDGLLTADRPPAPEALAPLLGRTRAAMLAVLHESGGCSTGELARATGTAAATASQHAAVLRAGGLILTRRMGGSVLHTLTPLGRDLLGPHRTH
ncbi:helix-turn-helix domain-containing protein [Kitasatospora sp. NPDC050543]|uniref:helix-turn-helix domain-containing protein n=1 Tax=Kitasatospora sp. NPDC050543 TaxID=3364054 RepID=UPI0037B4D277